MRILVCGGRDFFDYPYVCEVLKKYEGKATVVITGSGRGADKLGEEWADDWELPLLRFPANWEYFGKAAGPIRNQQMLDEGKPDVVVAFPGGRGTADMVRRAKSAGVRVEEVPRKEKEETNSRIAGTRMIR